MELFPIPQLQTPIPVTDESDYWDSFEKVSIQEKLSYPKDADKSAEEKSQTDGDRHIAAIRYQETMLKAEGHLFSQRHLEGLGVVSRPTEPCPFPKDHSMYVIRGSHLKRMSRIVKHEDLKAQGLLLEITDFRSIRLSVETTASHYIQDPDDQRTRDFGVLLPITDSGKALKPWKRIIFISHRWLDPLGSAGSPAHPDDAKNSKLAALRKVIADDDYVMLDYVSFAQDDLGEKDKAIQSLSWFIYHCSCFRAFVADDEALDEYLDRGWCQLEMLTAFCPVPSRAEEHRDGNFYMDYEDRAIDQFFVCASPNRATLSADRQPHPLAFSMLRNPNQLKFTEASDVERIQGPLQAIVDAFEQGRPRKESVSAPQEHSKAMTSHLNTTRSYRFDAATKEEHEAVLAMLSS